MRRRSRQADSEGNPLGRAFSFASTSNCWLLQSETQVIRSLPSLVRSEERPHQLS